MLGHLLHITTGRTAISHPPILPQWMRRAFAVIFAGIVASLGTAFKHLGEACAPQFRSPS